MLKSELLKLIESLGDEDDVLETLKENEEIKGLAKSLDTISIEDFKQLLASNKEIKGYYTSMLDSKISKAVNSHDSKFMAEKFPALLEEEIKKRSNEGLTEDQIKLKEMAAKIQQMEQDKLKAEMSSKYSKVLGEKGLSTDLIDFVLGTDDEVTNSNIEKINNIFVSMLQSGIKEKLGDFKYKPPGSNFDDKAITKEQFQNMTYQEKNNLYRTDKALYDQLKND